MEEAKQALDDVIYSWSKLKEVWEMLDPSELKNAGQEYPFDKDFVEVLKNLMDWRSTLD